MRKFSVSESGLFHPRTLLALALCLIGTFLTVFSFAATSPRASSKIAPWVMEKTADGKEAEFLVVLADQADLKGADSLATKKEKGAYVRDALWNKAQATQAPLLKWLQDRKIEHRSYYIVNLVWVRGARDLAMAMAERNDVASVEGNPQIRNFADPSPEPTMEVPCPEAVTTIETGITHTRAPEVWALGYTGQGVVVAGADTGYRWDHNALKNHYRGWNGTTANHDYNWHDSIHSTAGANSCGTNSTTPCDDHGHGTHTMGTVVGDDGATHQTGMAPGAKWIGCRNMDAGNGTPATYLECFEFFLAPYPVGGTTAQGDSTKAPDVTSNSWGCPASEGCAVNTLQAGVEAQRAAGIMMVVSAGNGGSAGCSTVSDPPAIYDAVYSVGALNTGFDTIASFSSRGPVSVDGSLRMKPDISAPGNPVTSSLRTGLNSYGAMSGTSMASPHVAGAVALLWSAQPALINNVSLTESILNDTAVHLTATSCSSSGSPNNVFGFGRLDIKAAVDRALTPLKISSVTQTGNDILLQGTGVANVPHTLKFSDSLSPANFAPLNPPVSVNAAGAWQYQDTGGANQPQRFYELTFP